MRSFFQSLQFNILVPTLKYFLLQLVSETHHFFLEPQVAIIRFSVFIGVELSLSVPRGLYAVVQRWFVSLRVGRKVTEELFPFILGVGP